MCVPLPFCGLAIFCRLSWMSSRSFVLRVAYPPASLPLHLLFEFARAEMPRVGGARTAEALVAVAVAVATIACVDTAEGAVAGTGRCVHGHSPVWDAALHAAALGGYVWFFKWAESAARL